MEDKHVYSLLTVALVICVLCAGVYQVDVFAQQRTLEECGGTSEQFEQLDISAIIDGSQDDVERIVLPGTKTTSGLGERILEYSRTDLEQNEDYAEELAGWREINPKVDAIIRIPELGLNYPVICNVEDNTEWLKKSVYGEEERHGSIYLDASCSLDESIIKIVHGHNMADATMFSKVTSYLYRETCVDIDPITLYTDEGILKYEVFAVFPINTKMEGMPIDIDYSVDGLWQLTEELLEKSVVPDGVVNRLDLLLLNTCWYGYSGTERNLHCIVACSRV